MWFNRIIASVLPFMPKSFVWIFSKRYIAGKKIDDAMNFHLQTECTGDAVMPILTLRILWAATKVFCTSKLRTNASFQNSYSCSDVDVSYGITNFHNGL